MDVGGLPHLPLRSKFTLSDWPKVAPHISGFVSPRLRTHPAPSSSLSAMNTEALRSHPPTKTAKARFRDTASPF